MLGMHPTLRNALFALVITGGIFATGFWTANTVNNLRINDIKETEERIAIDTLSLETQFDLMGQLACSDIAENSVLSSELNPLAERLAYAEETLGASNPQVISLKRQYSLLEIKDYLLMKEVTKKCGLKPVFVLYFYSNAGDCARCSAVGNILTYLRGKYAGLRVYSFDYHLDLGALKTLIAVTKIKPDLPILVIDGTPFYGLNDLASIEKSLPIEKLATSTAKTAPR
jgi:predicted Zn-dependent protease with MMP-like domain